MRRVVLAAIAALLLVPATAHGYEAGAAVRDIAPPLAGVADPAGFATCVGFTGPRVWAFDEPYQDLDADGSYDTGDVPCDVNLNGRRDQIWTSGAEIGAPLAARDVHDPITARAFAIRSGARTLVVVSVTVQGLFNAYVDRVVARAKALDPAITDMVVTADHNESTPDTIGVYGGPAVAGTLPTTSGIDDYYMDFLVEQVAQAAAAAERNLQPATIRVSQVPLPAGVKLRLSDNWPTTDNTTDKPVAIDPKLGVIQARGEGGEGGEPIFTVMNLAAHNQEIGHSGDPAVADDLSSDWPGFFASRVAAQGGGTGIFLVGDTGSQEDPITVPAVGTGEGSYAQAQATGAALADATLAAASGAAPIGDGEIRYARADFCVPLENNLFKGAAAAGLFGDRQTFATATCTAAGRAGDGLQTTVGVADVGPDLQLILNPGEAFPALVLGSRWGLEDVPAECRGRANPPVPTWLSHATFRLQVGLANDFMGYEIPPWAFIGQAGAFTTPDPGCNSGSGSTDSAGHHHKLESAGAGPAASGLIATNLTDLVKADGPDPAAQVVPGRFVLADGSLSRSPLGAVGIRLLDGETLSGPFIDYDGTQQAAPDELTRGIVWAPAGCAPRRIYLDVFPSATPGPATGPRPCPAQPTPTATPTATLTPTATPTPCVDRRRPRIAIGRAVWRRRILRARGTTSDRGCGNRPQRVSRVTVGFNGLTLILKGRARWRVRAEADAPPRRIRVTATDAAGNVARRFARVRRR